MQAHHHHVMAVFQRESDYFGHSPLDLTDHFCNAVNKSLVDAVDTFQGWVSRHMVTFSLAQCKRVLSTSAIGTAVSSKDINHTLREVLADCTTSPAAAAAAVAAHAYYKKHRKSRTTTTTTTSSSSSKSGKATEDDLTMVTADQLLEAAANLGLDSTVGDVNDIGVMLNVDVFRDVQGICDVLMTSLRQTADKTCDKFELYLLNNVFRIPDDLHVPGLDQEEIQMEATTSAEGSRYTEEDERGVDKDRESLRDQIIKLRRRNARLARTQNDLHVQLERWQTNMMPLVNAVAENVGGGEEETSNLSEVVRTVLHDAEQLSTTSSDIQSKWRRLGGWAVGRLTVVTFLTRWSFFFFFLLFLF